MGLFSAGRFLPEAHSVAVLGARQACSAAASLTQLSAVVVGSGPAGFYFADRLCRLLGDGVRVDILDRLPTPFGLVRSGVAPDHPDTKNVVNKFTAVASLPNVRFFGNVNVGVDVSVQELQGMYNCVALCYGSPCDRKLGIPGEEAAGVLSAREFVNWYNGHPDFAGLRVPLDKVESVGIVGLGNVALDCARVLLKPVAELEHTDIAEHALAQLHASAVRRVHILGRRGPLQAQFSGKELREALNLDNVSVAVHPTDYVPTDADLQEPRKNQKVFATMCKAHGRAARAPPERHLHLHFLSSPQRALTDPAGHVRALQVERTRLEAAAGGGQRAVGTGDLHELPMELLLRSVGYRGVPLPGVPYDAHAGIVPNAVGRVLQAPGTNDVVRGLYVSGWLRRGPQGIIGTNVVDAQQTAACVAEDAAALQAPRDPAALGTLLRDRCVPVFTWEHWLRIDQAEMAQGQKQGKRRVKLVSVDDMLSVAGLV